ncbi:MAG: hypothetical protein QM500_12150 [Methylococcales bacterium]
MSRYEWEKGEIIIPSKAYVFLRKAILNAYNNHLSSQLKKLAKLREYALAQGKGKRGFNFERCVDDNYYDMGVELDYIHLIFPLKDGSKPKRPACVSKKALPFANSKTRHFEVGSEAYIAFSDKERMLYWHVSENNHNVRDAHEHYLGGTLFSELSKIKWTRGSGGEISGNNEFNRDSDYCGGGANYIAHSFWPKSKEHRSSHSHPWHL